MEAHLANMLRYILNMLLLLFVSVLMRETVASQRSVLVPADIVKAAQRGDEAGVLALLDNERRGKELKTTQEEGKVEVKGRGE